RRTRIAWKLVELSAFLICFTITLYQCVIIFTIYLKHPYTVAISIDMQEKLRLPGITICSGIGVKRSEVQNMKEFKHEYDLVKARGNMNNETEQELLNRFYLQLIQ